MDVKDVKKAGMESVTIELSRAEVICLVAVIGDLSRSEVVERLRESNFSLPAEVVKEGVDAMSGDMDYSPIDHIYAGLYDLLRF